MGSLRVIERLGRRLGSDRRSLRQAVLSVAALLTLAAGAPAALAETAIERAARTGELALGVPGTAAPYFKEGANGQLQGYAIDVAGLIAAEVSDYLGRPVKVVSETTEGPEALFRQVHNGEVDLMCGAQFTWEREMFVDFSIPFALSGIRLLTQGGTLDGTPDSLRGKRIGVVKGSLGEATVKALQPAARLVAVPTLAAGLKALGQGQVDAVGGDSVLLATAAQAARLREPTLVPTVALNRYAVGCAMPENNSTLRNLVNLAIAKMLQGYVNGDAASRQLVNRWLGPDSELGLPEAMISLYFQSVLLNYEQIALPPQP
ncbi:extracellular substrate binding-like orphan protein GrrP [Cyanobium sp. NIES-981]|uniref:extracellular substrate binding-like orphan protein GrrP n=1 Tax=Cyanobium sp. NIES-981 TaxID=1851505 RepID=UPI0007DE15CA|nr:extracellular substrate binding-like orphan protein GrrP [Cyanobium sp. NIES-981]SBO44659.1 Extracellular solute-binding protein, family 3 [Cyanobium sp. NIES-981]